MAIVWRISSPRNLTARSGQICISFQSMLKMSLKTGEPKGSYANSLLATAYNGHVLVFQSILSDLRSLKWYQGALLLVFTICTILISVFDLNSVIEKKSNDDSSGPSESWRKVFMFFSGAASVTGVFCVFLVSLGKISCFFWGVLNCIFYGLFLFAYGYAGDAQLNVIFVLPMQYLGALQWMDEMENKNRVVNQDRHGSSAIGTRNEGRGEGEEEEGEEVPDLVVKTRSMSVRHWTAAMLITAAITVSFYFEIPLFAKALTGSYVFAGSPVPQSLDACSNGLSIVAQALLMMRFWETWLFWIAVNGVQFAMFAGASGTSIDINICLMLALFVLNAFYGLVLWYCNCYYSTSNSSIDNHIRLSGEKAIAASPAVSSGVVYSPLPTAGVDDGDSHVSFIADRDESRSASEGVVGVVVGKFYPFHRGHQHLVETALQHCTTLHVIVCHKPHERPGGQLRLDWVRELYPSGRVVAHQLLDTYDPDDSELWARLTIETINADNPSDEAIRPDVAFTSESYGAAFSRFLRCRHHSVDQSRATMPTSGTAVRREPLKQWAYLSAPLRGYYAKRFVVVGAESTGKTTLCGLLARHYATEEVAEYGREHSERKIAAKLSGETAEGEFTSVEWTSEDFLIIARQQNKNEMAQARAADRVLICDTDSFATYLWHEHYMESIDARILAIFDELKQCTDFASRHYFLMESEGVAFVQDGTRDGEHHRQWFFDRFREELVRLGLGFTVLRGGYAEREAEAKRMVDSFL